MSAQTTYLPMLFECWECERTHPLIEGGYVFSCGPNGEQLRLRETKFFCIPCANKVYGEEAVAEVLAAPAK